MKFSVALMLISFQLASCKKETIDSPSFSEARYTLTLEGKWNAPAFTVPAGAHFTNFAGMVHNSKAILWQEGRTASPGTEMMAESGNVNTLLLEIDSMMMANNAISLIAFIPPAATGGTKEVSVYCNSNYPQVSMAAMLGPTPDWFVGISGVNLYANGRWVGDTLVNLYPLDAGTEEGDVFGYSNPATVPQQLVHRLLPSQATVLANGNTALAPIATVRLRRQ